jgi:hypothetical protein
MPSQLQAFVWIVFTGEQIGEKLKGFRNLNNFQG